MAQSCHELIYFSAVICMLHIITIILNLKKNKVYEYVHAEDIVI